MRFLVTEKTLFTKMGIGGVYIEISFFLPKENNRVVLCEVNTTNVFWIYFSNQIDSYTLQKTPLNHFDWDNLQNRFSYLIEKDI